MNPLAIEALKIIAPLVTKKVLKKKEKKPTVVGGETIRDNFETEEVRVFDLKRTVITAIVGVLMAYGVSKGIITEEQAGIIDDVIIEQVDKATDG